MTLKNKNLYYFFYPLVFTVLILTLFCGIVIADKNIREIAFNDYSSMISFNIISGNSHYFGIKILGNTLTLDISFFYNLLDGAYNIGCKVLSRVSSIYLFLREFIQNTYMHIKYLF